MKKLITLTLFTSSLFAEMIPCHQTIHTRICSFSYYIHDLRAFRNTPGMEGMIHWDSYKPSLWLTFKEKRATNIAIRLWFKPEGKETITEHHYVVMDDRHDVIIGTGPGKLVKIEFTEIQPLQKETVNGTSSN